MVDATPDQREARLAEVVAALSLATDLGMGQPMGHALGTCLLAVGLGQGLGLAAPQPREVYYVALLRRIGCTSDARGGSRTTCRGTPARATRRFPAPAGSPGSSAKSRAADLFFFRVERPEFGEEKKG